ncbi:hypothetical protein ACWF94_32630 [Streptomyces sp. NPDC055078]
MTGLLGWLADELLGSNTFRTDLPLHAGEKAQAAFVSALAREVTAALEEPGLLQRYAAAQDAQDTGRLRPSLPKLDGVAPDGDFQVRLATGRARVTEVSVGGEDLVRLRGAGQEIDAAAAAAPLLRRLLQPGWHSLRDLAAAAHVPAEDAAALVSALVSAQIASVRAARR